MKKILITGANSYVGSSFKEWLTKYPEEYEVDTISLRDENWKKTPFTKYDVVLHTVGIAHVDAKPEMESLYYKVNRDLAIEAAKKSKEDKVKQFIFLSSIIVYGDSNKINKSRIINKHTIPTPANFYGNSKLQAEEGIQLLASNEFKVAIVRPPMIYGKGSKGNYLKLSKFACKLPVFPHINNQRSMLHIDHLSEFIRLIIKNNECGLFFPQNSEYVKTSDMVLEIAKANNKNIRLIKLFNPFLKLLGKRFSLINKVFGSLKYEQNLSIYKENYNIHSFEKSIQITEDK